MPYKDPQKAREVERRAHIKWYRNGGLAKRLAYQRKRAARDPVFRIRLRMSSYMAGVLKRVGASKRDVGWQATVGYSAQELVTHLESLFEPWMSWANYGKEWEIDHRLPICSFELPEQIKECWALSNLRPLEKIANRRKGGGPYRSYYAYPRPTKSANAAPMVVNGQKGSRGEPP